MLHIEPVRAFKDNYLWVYHKLGCSDAVVIDPGDAAPVQTYLQDKGLTLIAILVTHHHADHIGGIRELQQHWQVPVYGPATAKIPQVDHPVDDGDVIEVNGLSFRVIGVPGHTLDHIAYFAEIANGAPILFCGDTLFAAGCGRMFEGNAPMMHASLQKLAHLPPATSVYCAHEYTLSNLAFAAAALGSTPAVSKRLLEEQEKRQRNQPTVPSTIELELNTNPFLRCSDPAIFAALARQGQFPNEPAQAFAALRQWKDKF